MFGFGLGALLLGADGPRLLLQRLSLPVDTVELDVARGVASAAPLPPVPRGRPIASQIGSSTRGLASRRSGEPVDEVRSRARSAASLPRVRPERVELTPPRRRPRGRPAPGTAVVQVSATPLEDPARALATKLRRAGFDAYLLEGEELYRVRVQPRGTQSVQQLSAALARLGHDGFALRE